MKCSSERLQFHNWPSFWCKKTTTWGYLFPKIQQILKHFTRMHTTFYQELYLVQHIEQYSEDKKKMINQKQSFCGGEND